MNSNQRAAKGRRGLVGWILGIALAAVVIVLLGSVLFLGGWTMMGAGPYYYYPRPFFGFFFFPFGIILFFIAIFLLFRLAFRPWRRGYYGHWRSWDSAEEILRQRYARGEITKEQFEEMRRDIESRP